jgi:hypothetical protein
MIPIVLRFLSLLEKKSHACDVYESRDLKYSSRDVLCNFGQFEGLSVETASRGDKCQLLIADISTGSILSVLTTIRICVDIQLYVAE